MDKINYYVAQIDKKLAEYPVFVKIEGVSKVPKAYIALGLSFVVSLFLMFDCGGQFITNVLGWSYPALVSLDSIDRKDNSKNVKLLSYWVIFSFLEFLEFFKGKLLYLIPFYYLFKAVFIMWLYIPGLDGAEKLYTSFISSVYSMVKQKACSTFSMLDDVKYKAQKAMDNTKEKAEERLR